MAHARACPSYAVQACGSQRPALSTLGMAASLYRQHTLPASSPLQDILSNLSRLSCLSWRTSMPHFSTILSQMCQSCCHSAYHLCVCCVFQEMHGIPRAMVGLCRAPVLWSGLALRASCIQASAVIAWLMSGLLLPSCAAGVAREACAAFACITRNITVQRHTLWAFLGLLLANPTPALSCVTPSLPPLCGTCSEAQTRRPLQILSSPCTLPKRERKEFQ